jgi:hypothetical protein
MLGRCGHHPDIAITTVACFGSVRPPKNMWFFSILFQVRKRAFPGFRKDELKQRFAAIFAEVAAENFTV